MIYPSSCPGILEIGALDSAKRFYSQVLNIAGKEVLFSNVEAPMRWMIAYLEDDMPGMEAAVDDAPSYSALDLQKQTAHWFVKGDRLRVLKISNAYSQRYGTKFSGTGWLAKMMLLMNALKDAKHSDHSAALNHFYDGSPVAELQFIVLKQSGLSDSECLRLLEGADPHPNKDIIRSYFKKNVLEFNHARSERVTGRQSGMIQALQGLLRHKLIKTPVALGQKDMKPKGR
ncbi:MAG: hypothetical protein IPK32_04220 [Verrucomicrobiaceae bacterium]|nr:hypothetical protein [Verrucomicrobiaceae bacterium]